jgi:hypothetical protein
LTKQKKFAVGKGQLAKSSIKEVPFETEIVHRQSKSPGKIANCTLPIANLSLATE